MQNTLWQSRNDPKWFLKKHFWKNVDGKRDPPFIAIAKRKISIFNPSLTLFAFLVQIFSKKVKNSEVVEHQQSPKNLYDVSSSYHHFQNMNIKNRCHGPFMPGKYQN